MVGFLRSCPIEATKVSLWVWSCFSASILFARVIIPVTLPLKSFIGTL